MTDTLRIVITGGELADRQAARQALQSAGLPAEIAEAESVEEDRGDMAPLLADLRARAEREAMINRIGVALRVSLDADEIVRIICEQVGPALGVSRCVWARLNEARDAFEVTLPSPEEEGEAGVDRYPLADCPPEVMDEWVAGRPVAVADAAEDPRRLAGGRLLPARAFLACPVFGRGQLRGIFSAEHTDGPRAWSADEASFLTSVAGMLALALENADLYAREHRVADMLSSAFLSDIPDTLPGLSLATCYRAGLEEARVGGDCYDAFPLPDGRIALVIADVSGKGLNAAVQTATVKYALRAFATEDGAPGRVLSRLNRLLCEESSGLGDHFVTLFYAAFHPLEGTLDWANAGHETVLVKRGGGDVDRLPATGPILGIGDHSYAQSSTILAPGDSLILYTDGLTEARAPGTREMLDLDRVAALVASAPPEAGPGALAALLERAALRWTGGRPQDDLALLAARRRLPDEDASPSAAGLRFRQQAFVDWE